MKIKHITERLGGCHMGQCAAHQGDLCDCGATTNADTTRPAPVERIDETPQVAPWFHNLVRKAYLKWKDQA